MAAGDQPTAEAGDEDRMLSGWAPRKSETGRFKSARAGDDLMVPFECDFCVFGKLFDHVQDPTCDKDVFAMGCIRRVILDAFWSRAHSTVTNNATKVREGLKISLSMGMRGPYENPGPFTSEDTFGYEVAIQMGIARCWTIRSYSKAVGYGATTENGLLKSASIGTKGKFADYQFGGWQWKELSTTGHRCMWVVVV